MRLKSNAPYAKKTMHRVVRHNWLSWATYGGMFVFGIVMALLGAVLPVLSERIQFDLGQAGTLFFTLNLAMLLTSVCLGPLMDRFGKKPPLVVGSLLVALAQVLLVGASSYSSLLASVFGLGIGGGCLNGATNTLIADLHSEERRKNAALNLLGVFFGFGALSLPFLIGSVLRSLGLNVILYLSAGLSLLPAVSFSLLAFPPPKMGAAFRMSDAGALARNPLVLLLGFLLFFQSGNEFIMGGYTSTYLRNHFGSSIGAASYVLAGYWASIMLARVIWSRLLLRVRGARLVLVSSLLSAVGVGLLLLAPSKSLAALALILIGASFAAIFPTTLGLAGSLFEAYSGTVFGILFTIALTGGMILPWAVGQLATIKGLRSALLLAIGNSVMIFILQLLVSRRKSY